MSSIYQKLFKYYITSEPYFTWNVEWFCIASRLVGECGDQALHFESAHYRDWYERLHRAGSFWFELSNERIRHYFNHIENEDVLSVVIFAHWLQLPEAEIEQLRQAKKESCVQQLLFSFISKPEDIYFISMPDDTEMKATRNGDELLAEDGTIYEID